MKIYRPGSNAHVPTPHVPTQETYAENRLYVHSFAEFLVVVQPIALTPEKLVKVHQPWLRSIHCDKMNNTSFSMSASETRGEYGGMAIPPVTSVQLPLPPDFTLEIKRALAPGSPW